MLYCVAVALSSRLALLSEEERLDTVRYLFVLTFFNSRPFSITDCQL